MIPTVVAIALIMGALNLGFLMGRFFERWQDWNRRGK